MSKHARVTLSMLILAASAGASTGLGSETGADAPPQGPYEFRFAFGTYCS
ncbi:MAG: hypothetical protein JSU63_06635 [Phycisphaerales bacterium]|nr:MAG: hypothetical protein JSU63_06635 [Phycisphaerales bacterium]